MPKSLRDVRIRTLGFIVVGALLALSALSIALSIKNLFEVERTEAAWQDSYSAAATEAELLWQLRGELGYGGFIHNFKNFVLRKDAARLEDSQSNLDSARIILSDLSTMLTDPTELGLISDIHAVLERYESGLKTAQEMAASGATSGQIDGIVKVDDARAIVALDDLEHRMESTRRNSAEAVGIALSGLVNFHARTEMGVAVFVALVCAVIIWLLQARVTIPLARFRHVMIAVAAGDFSVVVPESGRADEIGEMSDALRLFQHNAREMQRIRRKQLDAEKRALGAENRATEETHRRVIERERNRREIEELKNRELSEEVEEKIKELRRSEAHVDGILDSVLDAFVSADEQGLILSFNKAAEQMFGYSAAEAIGQSINILMPEELTPVHDVYFTELRRISEPLILGAGRKLHGRRKDGSTFPLYVAVTSLDIGEDFILVAVISDRTKEVRSEQKAERLSRLVDRSVREVFVLEARSLNILEANTRASESLGYTIAELEEMSLPDICFGKSRAEFDKVIEPLVVGETEELVFEGEHKRKDGGVYPVETHLHYWTQDDPPVFLAVVQDITQRLTARHELMAARDAAESANRTKSSFLANMSHELRTPLNAITGYGELLVDIAQENGHTDYIQDLERINYASEHLLTLINDVLDLSKIEAGKADIVIREIDLQGLAEEVVLLTEPQAEAGNNKIELGISKSARRMWSDEGRIRQILVNLLGNAAKFTQHGTLSLEIENIEVDGKPHVEFKVSDTGVGIPPSKVPGAFDEFTQAHSNGSSAQEGSGLGLAICHRLCRAMKGDIRLFSVLGRGTTVTATLPEDLRPYQDGKEIMLLSESLENNDMKENLLPGENGVICVIEDDNAIGELLKHHLEAEGYEVHLAHTGAEGLSKAQRYRPAVILLDLLLPDTTGKLLLEEIRLLPELDDTEVIICSGNSEASIDEVLSKNTFLAKPVHRAELVEALSRTKLVSRS